MNGLSKSGHSIRWHRETPKDRFYTPDALAGICVETVPILPGQTCCDPCEGHGAFLNHLPPGSTSCEIDKGTDFFEMEEPVDWLVSNPPYSMLDKWLEHSAEVSRVGFAYLLGWNNLTARRIERMEKAGFGITSLTMFKVFEWYGMSAFVVWERGATGILQYDRTVWRHEDQIKKGDS